MVVAGLDLRAAPIPTVRRAPTFHRRSPSFHPGMRLLITRLIFILAVTLVGAEIAWFIHVARPDIFSALRTLPGQLSGEWRFPTHSAMAILTVVILWVGASGVGHWFLERFCPARTLASPWARWVLATLIGWVILSLIVLELGLLGLSRRGVIGGAVVVFCAWGITGWREFIERIRPMLEGEAGTAELALPGWIMILALVIYAVGVPYAVTPAVESDELRYHLAAPESWLAAGRIQYLPFRAHSNFPFAVEMLFMAAMALQGTEAARLLHFTFLESAGILTGLLAFLLIRAGGRAGGLYRGARSTRLARGTAATAAAAFVSMPVATILACWAFNDVAMTAFFMAVVYLGAVNLVARRPVPEWIPGMMIGACLSTKYTMIPIMGALTAVLMVLMRLRGTGSADLMDDSARATGFAMQGESDAASRAGGERAGRDGSGPVATYFLRVAIVASLVAGPWYFKNLFWTVNPVYPGAHGWFGGGEWSAENAAFMTAKAAEKGMSADAIYAWLGERGIILDFLRGPGARLFEFLATPLTTTFAWERFESHFPGPAPLFALVLMLAGAVSGLGPRARAARPRARLAPRAALSLWVGALLLVTWIIWFLTYQSNRLLLPLFALLASAGGAGAWRLIAWNGKSEPDLGVRMRIRVLRVLATLALAISLFVSATIIVGVRRPFAFALGYEARSAYLDQHIEYHRAAVWLGERADVEARALLIGEHRTLYFPLYVVASDWFDTPQPLPYIRTVLEKPGTDVVRLMREDRIRYVLFNRTELARYHDRYFRPRFTPEEYAMFESLTGYSSGSPDPAFEPAYGPDENGIVIWRIAPGPGAGGADLKDIAAPAGSRAPDSAGAVPGGTL